MGIPRQHPDEPWNRFIQRAARVFRRAAVYASDPQSRLELLKAFAAVKVDNWGAKRIVTITKRYRKIRVKSSRGPSAACFVCGTPATTRHHVIQLQYGGGHHRRNKVPICQRCHKRVHPWMEG